VPEQEPIKRFKVIVPSRTVIRGGCSRCSWPSVFGGPRCCSKVCPFRTQMSGNTPLGLILIGAAIRMEAVMSIIDQALKANERYAKTYDPKWGGKGLHDRKLWS